MFWWTVHTQVLCLLLRTNQYTQVSSYFWKFLKAYCWVTFFEFNISFFEVTQYCFYFCTLSTPTFIHTVSFFPGHTFVISSLSKNRWNVFCINQIHRVLSLKVNFARIPCTHNKYLAVHTAYYVVSRTLQVLLTLQLLGRNVRINLFSEAGIPAAWYLVFSTFIR
jgi:hypothetical protein